MSPGAAVATAIGTQGYCRTTADGAADVGHSAEVLCAAADGDARLQAWGRCGIDDELLTAAALVAAGTTRPTSALIAT